MEQSEEQQQAAYEWAQPVLRGSICRGSRTRVVQGNGGLDRARTYAGEAAEEAGVPRAALRVAGWLCVQRE